MEEVYKAGYKIEVVRSRRRTWSLRMLASDHLILGLPQGSSDEEVTRFLEEKAGWVDKKRALLAQREKVLEKISFTFPGRVLYQGRFYDLRAEAWSGSGPGPGHGFILREGALLLVYSKKVSLSQLDPATLFFTFLRRRAKDKIVPLVYERAQQIERWGGRPLNRVVIKAQRSRWGSCSAKGNINLNARLLMLDKDLQDYLIYHELVHLVELNHSPAFYRRLEDLLPNYKVLEKRLHDQDVLLKL